MIGSAFEWNRIKSRDFPLFGDDSSFTDDSVLTVAVASAILSGRDYAEALRDYGTRYPSSGYGALFYQWLGDSKMGPYDSWGNGSAMRVSPVGFAGDSKQWVLDEAKRSAEVTHNHPEGVKGAQATALAVFLGKLGATKSRVRSEIERRFGYDLSRTVEEIRADYSFDESCPGTVPEAIISFLESEDFEDAIRNAVSLGGDSDTLACIAGGIAEAYYGGVPAEIRKPVEERLPREFLDVIEEFEANYPYRSVT